MKKLIKNYKQALLLLIGIVIILIVWLNSESAPGIKVPKYTTKTTEESQIPESSISSIYLVKATPPSGSGAEKWERVIKLQFSGNVDVKNAQIKVEPYISLRLKALTPKEIMIYPDKTFWREHISYHIWVKNLTDGTTGKPIKEIEYIYKYVKPTGGIPGEAWLLDATPEEKAEYMKGFAH